ncbi:hypothetical protein KN1_09550 [Stygiolobus caldivivus]|uniref:Uncharacterized protein n=1 Tax=Stygiolobus caldivivus TaxID=2824673 RepID=A0A8D5ZEG4_9CREN|nr:hypothetical protein KN1_09550 [Stygiolobus caldivivus]
MDVSLKPILKWYGAVPDGDKGELFTFHRYVISVRCTSRGGHIIVNSIICFHLLFLYSVHVYNVFPVF